MNKNNSTFVSTTTYCNKLNKISNNLFPNLKICYDDLLFNNKNNFQLLIDKLISLNNNYNSNIKFDDVNNNIHRVE
jgi:hypothetical protein